MAINNEKDNKYTELTLGIHASCGEYVPSKETQWSLSLLKASCGLDSKYGCFAALGTDGESSWRSILNDITNKYGDDIDWDDINKK